MKISHVSKGVILNPSVVTLNASYVILNEVKNLRAGSVKSLRVNRVKASPDRSEGTLASSDSSASPQNAPRILRLSLH